MKARRQAWLFAFWGSFLGFERDNIGVWGCRGALEERGPIVNFHPHTVYGGLYIYIYIYIYIYRKWSSFFQIF